MILAPSNLKAKRFTSSSIELLEYKSQKSIKNQKAFFEKNALIFVLKGAKILSCQSHTFHLKQHDCLLIPKGNYTFSNLAYQNTYHALLFFFEDHFEFANPPHKIQSSSFDSFKAHHLLICFMHSLIEQNEILQIQEFLELKAKELGFLLSIKHPHHLAYFLQRIQTSSFINQLQKQEVMFESVQSMAKNFKISPSIFSKKFKEELGISPKEWLDTLRLSQAKTMLSLSDKNISQIASELNFSSSAWFIKRFKKNFGLTPKQYQKQAKNHYF